MGACFRSQLDLARHVRKVRIHDWRGVAAVASRRRGLVDHFLAKPAAAGRFAESAAGDRVEGHWRDEIGEESVHLQ